MLVTKATLDGLRKSFSAVYQEAFTQSPDWAGPVAMDVPSSTRSNVYGWMNELPRMREWIGPRQIRNMSEQVYTLENKSWELTVGVDRNDIEDDNLGVYTPRIRMMGESARKLRDDRITAAIQDGTTALGFDGVAFFATTHDLDASGNQSNLFTSTALTAANFDTTFAAMASYTGYNGEPLGVMPDTLIVPPQLRYEADEIVKAERNAAGASNMLKGYANVIVAPELANQPTVWYLAQLSSAVKPIVYQVRQAPQMQMKTNPSDDNVFFERQFVYGVDARVAAGYGPWFLMARCIA